MALCLGSLGFTNPPFKGLVSRRNLADIPISHSWLCSIQWSLPPNPNVESRLGWSWSWYTFQCSGRNSYNDQALQWLLHTVFCHFTIDVIAQSLNAFLSGIPTIRVKGRGKGPAENAKYSLAARRGHVTRVGQ